jgi:hypothetical protein
MSITTGGASFGPSKLEEEFTPIEQLLVHVNLKIGSLKESFSAK